MKRAAAVAKILCEHMHIDERDVCIAMLLHDMGNMVKFNLSLYPQYLEPEGFEYWVKVQKEYFSSYGRDSHKATMAIVSELGVSERIKDLIAHVGYIYAEEVAVSNDTAKMICCYADQRVEIDGVTDLATRLQKGRERFLKGKEAYKDVGEDGSHVLLQIESELMGKGDMHPDEINQDSVNAMLKSIPFDDWEIVTISAYA